MEHPTPTSRGIKIGSLVRVKYGKNKSTYVVLEIIKISREQYHVRVKRLFDRSGAKAHPRHVSLYDLHYVHRIEGWSNV